MISISTITIKATEPLLVARFWSDLLGYEVAPNHTSSVLLRGAGPDLLIQPADTEPRGGAIHLDLRPDDAEQAVARAFELGATRAEIGQTGREGWTVLRDPGGNLFCILQSKADFAAVEAADPGEPTVLERIAVDEVMARERELQTPAARANADRLRELLAPDFVEIGASGRRWDRESILALLATEDATSGAEQIEVHALEARALSDGLVQVFWESVRDGRRARRTSLWRRGADGWRQVFHQGTPLP